MGPLLGLLKPTVFLKPMGPLKSMGPGVIVPPAPHRWPCSWLNTHQFTPNEHHEAIIIALKVRSPSSTISILINDIPLPIVDSFRYLGVIMDNKLTFFDPISNVAKKVSWSVGIISKLRHYAPTLILLKLCYAILHPHLFYGIIVWGSTYISYLQKLVSLKNKALKLITNNFTFHPPFVSVSLLYRVSIKSVCTLKKL